MPLSNGGKGGGIGHTWVSLHVPIQESTQGPRGRNDTQAVKTSNKQPWLFESSAAVWPVCQNGSLFTEMYFKRDRG